MVAAKPGQAGSRWRVMVRTGVAAVLGAWLCWQIGAAGIATLAAKSGNIDLLAMTGNSSHPQAGSVLSQALLAAGNPDGAARLARSVVLTDPTNDRALRVLGLATEQLGQRKRGAAIMREAAALGWRDTPTQLWMIRDAAMRDDFTTLMHRADALARRNRSGEVTAPIFLASITEPNLRAALVDSLGRQPMWRGAFFADVRQRLPESSMNAMEALFRDMRADGQAIGPIEWLSYVDRLIGLGQFRRARDIWVDAFAIPRGRLGTIPYDGDFRLVAARPADMVVSQFEWVRNPDLEGVVTFASDATGSHLQLPTQITGGTMIVTQLTALSPGEHLLTADVNGSATAAAAGWTLACQPSGMELPRRLSRGSQDELSNVTFNVPTQGCEAQKLILISRDLLDAQPVTVSNVRIR